MKSLELQLNKSLLIVEFDDLDHLDNVLSCDKQGIRFCTDDDEPTKLICKGSELNEDIAYEIVDGFDLSYFVDYNHHNPRAYKLTAIESFISAIQAKNYHWGENPAKKPVYNVVNYGTLPGSYRKYVSDLNEWKEAETRTFYPEKCIIFEIL